MITVDRILEMSNEEILKGLSEDELCLVDDNFANRNHFCDMYQDSARQCGEDEHFNPSQYLKLYIESR